MMRKTLTLAALCAALACLPAPAAAGAKQDAKIAYVVRNMKLKGEAQARLRTLLAAYYKDVSQAKAGHKALKEKLAAAEAANRLTPQQCDQLFESKQRQEAAELAVRKKHYALFKASLTPQQAYNAIRLANDKVK